MLSIMSMFSASIPRGGEGRVRIIPIVRKGYSLFSPARIGALTIASFNRIHSEEENTGWRANWLGNCSLLRGFSRRQSPC